MSTLFEDNHIYDNYCSAFIVETACAEYFPIQHHWHYMYEMLFVLEGAIIVECVDCKYKVEQDQMILLLPQHIHAIYTCPDMQAQYIVVKFNGIVFSSNKIYSLDLQQALAKMGNTNLQIVFSHTHLDINKMKQMLLEIIEEHGGMKDGYDVVTEANLNKIFVQIMRYWKDCSQSKDVIAGVYHERSRFDHVLKYIDIHCNENIQLKNLADMCHMDYAVFSKKFKSIFGYTFKQYLMHIRISKAQDLLLFTDHDLSYISQEVGFSDSSHFIKCYKKVKNITPNEFRKTLI